MSQGVFPPLQFLRRVWELVVVLLCLVDFISEDIRSELFFHQKMFDYGFNLLTSYSAIQSFLFCFHGLVLVGCVFLGICSFRLGYFIWWHTVVHSTLTIFFISVDLVVMSLFSVPILAILSVLFFLSPSS